MSSSEYWKEFSAAALLVGIALAVSPHAALAHGGGLDSLGCHHNRKAANYHCHRGPLAGQHFKSRAQANDRHSATIEVTGKPRIIDGDTIAIDKQRIRLHGIDAPETRQKCRGRKGSETNCGRMATAALAQLIRGQSVTCHGTERDRYKRLVAKCFVGRTDIGEQPVIQGWALAYRRYSKDYVQAELAAQTLQAGLWRGTFVPPWDWRRLKR